MGLRQFKSNFLRSVRQLLYLPQVEQTLKSLVHNRFPQMHVSIYDFGFTDVSNMLKKTSINCFNLWILFCLYQHFKENRKLMTYFLIFLRVVGNCLIFCICHLNIIKFPSQFPEKLRKEGKKLHENLSY